MSIPLSEQIASLALDTFSKLPPRCKPRTLPDGRKEWTPMSAIVLHQPGEFCEADSNILPDKIEIVSLATGTKSIPVSALSKCKGLILHDCHAEILALRGFNYWLLAEIRRMLDSESYESIWLEFTSPGDGAHSSSHKWSPFPFRLREGVQVSLFSTEAPCGDASMELLMNATEAAGRDITPWPVTTAVPNISTPQLPPGRGCFSNLGALRRKPARADAEISMSKSCTDKLMMKQFTGLLAFPADLSIEPNPETFLKRMIVYEDRWSKEGYTRAFGTQGRLMELLPAVRQKNTRQANFFEVNTLPQNFRRFEYEKNADGQRSRASNMSALWIAGNNSSEGVVEVLLNGVKQGFRQFDDRERKGSVICRRNMVQEGMSIASLLERKFTPLLLIPAAAGRAPISYSELKSQHCRSETALLKQSILDGLGGWPRKEHEDDFDISIELHPG